MYRNKTIALLIPCFNEEKTVTKVIKDFAEVMPELNIYVYDNMSTDKTKEYALNAGAQVTSVHRKGKGNVIRQMFADIDADVYIMVDGDDTYDAEPIHKMVDKLIDENLDMVVGCRKVSKEMAEKAYRTGHQLGNKVLTSSVMKIFGGKFTDMLSGYRVFSKRFVKSFPALSNGFETETELTIHALSLRMPYGEVMTNYSDRPEGSVSKLSTYKDGARILKTIIKLFMREKPFTFFSIVSAVFCVLAILLATPVFIEYFETGLVPRLPTAVLASMCMLSAFVSFSCGLVLDNVSVARQEIRRIAYLFVK